MENYAIIRDCTPEDSASCLKMRKLYQPLTRRSIRVFISSTFRDMRADREVLVKRIFPQLRKICEGRGVSWTEVDLRWGITTEQQADGRVLSYCLAEVERCRPFFIGLLGERYGSIPEVIADDLLTRERWLDDYAGRSVTELEVLHGVLNNPTLASHAFFYFRDPAYAMSVPSIQEHDFLESGSGAARRRRRLKSLKNRIRLSFKRNALLNAPRENYANPKALGEWVLADFTRIIDELYPAEEAPDDLNRLTARHAIYGRVRRTKSLPRPSYYFRLDEHVAGDGVPLVLTGPPGCGKTTLLAGWLDQWRSEHAGELVIEHFVGASPESAAAASLLTRVLQLARRDIGFESDIPLDERVFGWFEYLIGQAAAKQRFVLVIDSVDQVASPAGLPELGWLPARFAPNCRVVVTVTNGRALEVLEARGWAVLEIAPCNEQERRRIIAAFLDSCGKSISSDAMECLICSEHTGSPQYLTWLLEELRYIDQHNLVQPRLDEYLSADGQDALLAKIIQRWLADYSEGCDLARQSLVLLLAARDGLSQEELLSVLDGPNGEPVPRAVATPFFFAAEPVLTLSDDQMVIRTGTIERAVRDAVIGPLTDRMRAHERLSDLFRILDDGESRKLRELPMHLMATEQWQELRDLLVRPAFLTPLIEHHQEDLAFWWERLRVHFDPVESYEITWRELEQAADRDEAWASSSESIGKALYLLGHPAPAASVLSEVVEAVASTHGRNNPKYADAARALGVALSEAGRHQDAVPWLRDALESDRNSLGLYNQETLSALSSLAGCLAYLGDHEAAEPLLRQVIDANSEIFGRRDPVTLIAINNLVGSFLMHGDFEEAEPLQREVIEILRETRSEDDRFFLTAMNNWASILEGKAAFDEAEQLYRKVLAGRERVLGEEHPETVQAMSNLAKLLQHTGNLGGAAALFVEALAILDRAPAVNRFDQAVISQNYGALLSMMNDSAAAEHWCRRGLELFRAALPSGHPHLLAAMTNLAVVMLEIKNPTAATPLLQEAFAGYRRTMGIHHPYTKNVTLLFAHVLAEQDDRGAAAALLFEADLAQSSNDIDSDDSVRIDSSDADSIDVDPTVRALSALATAHEYSDIYKLVERFAFVTSTEFIARLEALGGTLSTEESSALLERVALLRHLAAGKPLTAVSNPVVEAFAALRRAARQGDEPMLLRLYPFLRSSVVLENLREMAAENNNCVAAENVDRVARYAAK